MSMPGSFSAGSTASGISRRQQQQRREASEDEALLSLTSEGDDEFMLAESDEGTIGPAGNSEDDDDDDDDDDDYDDEQAEFMDADDIEEEIYLDDDEQFELEIDDEDDSENDNDDEGIDPELAEAQRMASAAEVANESNATPRQQRYTLAVDPTTNSIYIVDSEGTHTEIGSTTADSTTDSATAADGTARPRRALTSDATLAVLRRMLGRTRATRMFGPGGDDDEEEDDDDDIYRFGGAGGRRSAAPLFPKVTEPIQAGVDLERKGLFGRPGKKYDSYPRRKFSPYQTNLNDTMRTREYRSCARPTDRLSLGDAAIPNSAGTEVAQYDDRVYCGQYSKDGSLFYTCAKDYKIRIYDMTTTSKNKSVLDPDEDDGGDPRSRRYRMHRMFGHRDKTSLSSHKTVQAREHLCQWTITDANLSPDNTKMIWSSISPVVGMTRFKESTNNGNEAADYENLDDGDGQVSLDFGSGAFGRRHHFGIWSVRFSADGREIIAGAGSGAIHVYDLEAKRTILSIRAHADDVNAVCFADTASSNVLVSGSDDNYLKVWDRRSLGEEGSFTKPSGVLVGHTEGVTFVAPKGDGRFVISNGKDQTCKLWDLRMMYSSAEFDKLDRLDVSVRGFDYRYSLYRKPRYAQHPHDRSVMTYTGHMVMQTLIRCHFSPEATTGQRYIYSGSYDGRIHIWNLDGTIAQVLDRSQMIPLLTRGAVSNHIKMNDPSMPDRAPGSYPVAASSPVVRDVSWAPYSPNIMSSAWTESGGSVAMHEWKGYGKRRQNDTA